METKQDELVKFIENAGVFYQQLEIFVKELKRLQMIECLQEDIQSENETLKADLKRTGEFLIERTDDYEKLKQQLENKPAKVENPYEVALRIISEWREWLQTTPVGEGNIDFVSYVERKKEGK